MESVNDNKYNISPSYSYMQRDILEMFKAQNPNLASISCSNNMLYYNGESYPLGYFRLNHLLPETCKLEAKDFFFLVKLMADIENNINEEDYYLFYINEILNKMILSDSEKELLFNFINKYLLLQSYKPYLIGISNNTLNKYERLIKSINPNSLNDGVNLLKQYIPLEQNEDLGGHENSLTRVLKDPNTPNILPKDDPVYSKAGFISIVLIIYSVINAAIILAIKLMK